ncbi:hypothetical protein C5167_003911 [Papaver somniferum]|uniref:Uncharacterized protein n=1 Tax=Papaver somniferum TaxID=3469 RepID=A0A4Y7L029_PAPSO|nr:hypothetical protein C5167_003911 [Papaver somniferum]
MSKHNYLVDPMVVNKLKQNHEERSIFGCKEEEIQSVFADAGFLLEIALVQYYENLDDAASAINDYYFISGPSFPADIYITVRKKLMKKIYLKTLLAPLYRVTGSFPLNDGVNGSLVMFIFSVFLHYVDLQVILADQRF